jgi:hypothetical protein
LQSNCQIQQQKKARFEAKAEAGKKSVDFLFKEINALKRQLKPEKTESILSTKINLTTSSDEGEQQEYLFTSSKPFIFSKTKLAKASHPTNEMVVSLIVNNEEHLLRALADTGASSSIILEAHTSFAFIKIDDSNTTTWSTMVGKFTTTKTGFVTFSLPEFNLKKRMYSSWAFHVDDSSESSSTYDMIMGRDLLGELGIIMNFNDHTVTWDTDNIPLKDRDTAFYHQ